MKAIRLHVKGFGPYVGEQEVDFKQLKDAPLFLICGPTGSGKSTLLDGICFGLYGDTSGGSRDGRQMRSDFLEPSQLTEITFDFDIGPESYRVRRTPAQIRPRRRGAGTTEEPATATLWRRTCIDDPNNDGEVLASQPTNVTEKMTELLGFECSQFRQVVVLPQGEFRKFLCATSREREQILEVLFQTESFRHIEEELKSRSKEIEEDVQIVRQRIGNFLEAAQADSVDELGRRRDAAQQRLQELGGEVDIAGRAETAAQQNMETARETIGKLSELDAACKALSGVQGRQGEIDLMREKVAAAQKAEKLIDLERSVQDRNQEHARAREAAGIRSGERTRAEQEELAARERLAAEEERSEVRASAAREVQRLSDFRSRVEKIILAAGEVEAAETEHDKQAAECELLETQVRDLTAKVGERDHRIMTLQCAAQQLDFLSLSAQRSEGLFQTRRRLDQVSAALDDARRQFEKRKSSYSQKSEELQQARLGTDELQSDWLAAQAAILAANLAEGSACPVCGATEHPAPATFERPLPEEQELKRLQNIVQELEQQVGPIRDQAGEAQNEVVRLETETSNLNAQLGEAVSKPVSQLASEFQIARLDLAASRRAAEDLTHVMNEQKRDRDQLAGISDQLLSEKCRLQASSTRLVTARQSLAERQDGVPEVLRTSEALEQAIGNASRQLESLTKAYETARNAVSESSRESARCAAAHNSAVATEQTAAERARTTDKEFAGRLEQAGLTGLDDFNTAKLAIAQLAKMDKAIRDFQAEISAAKYRLGRACGAAAGLEPPDFPGIEQELAAAKAKVSGLMTEQHQCSEALKSVDRFLDQLKEAQDKLQSLEAAHQIYGKIADVASGGNQMRITFQRFVQGALFEDVLQAASLRLRKMTKERFELQRALQAADGRHSGGLDIVVLDSHTGTTRPVSSLSGGEGFMASLSLALGLADVVQNRTGGVRLQSLFIDEGFGALDPEALDQALQVLTELRQGGRLIGIISHVSDLKERIGARIEVLPQARGSIARIVGVIPAS